MTNENQYIADKTLSDGSTKTSNYHNTMESDAYYYTFRSASLDAIKQAEKAYHVHDPHDGLSSGFSELDDFYNGFHGGGLYVLAGRDNMGKTELATQIATNVATSLYENAKEKEEYEMPTFKNSVLYFSLGIPADRLAKVIITHKADLSFRHVQRGTLEQNQLDDLSRVAQEMAKLPLLIDDTAVLSMEELKLRTNHIYRTQGLDMIVIKDLQLLAGVHREYHHIPNSQYQNSYKKTSKVMKQLRALAKEFNIPILVLSNVPEDVEENRNYSPELKDLEKMGSIEACADVVMFLSSPSYYIKRDVPEREDKETDENFAHRVDEYHRLLSVWRGTLKLDIHKNNFGASGTLDLSYDDNGKITKVELGT